MSYFATQLMDEEGNISYALTGAGYGALIAVMLGVLLLGCMVSGGHGRKIGTKQLVFSAMAMAL